MFQHLSIVHILQGLLMGQLSCQFKPTILHSAVHSDTYNPVHNSFFSCDTISPCASSQTYPLCPQIPLEEPTSTTLPSASPRYSFCPLSSEIWFSPKDSLYFYRVEVSHFSIPHAFHVVFFLPTLLSEYK